jgi:PAS domain S-box-containing protein
MACTAASCGLAAAAGGRFASRRGGPFAAKVLIVVLIVAGFALSAVVAGVGQVLAASSVLVATAVLVSRGSTLSRGAFVLVIIAALGLGLFDGYGPSGRLVLGNRFALTGMATAALLWMAGLCSLARFSVRTAVTLELISTTAAAWALSVRQGGGGDAVWAGLLCGLVLSMTALSLVVLSAEGRERNPLGVRHRDAGGLATAAAQSTDEDEVRALVNSARVLMWLSDPDGRRTYLNNSWLEFTGRTMEEESGNGWTAGVHPEDARRLAERGNAALGAGLPFETEYRLRRFDGEYHWILERGQPWIGPDGVLLGCVGSCVDISERKLREAALQEERSQLAQKVDERTSELARANAELAKAARLKDDFLANVSHELRTPLTAILGLAEALLGEAQGPLTPKQHKALQTIEASGQHLLSLINELLDLARIEAGHMTIDIKEGVSIDAVCEGSLRFIKQIAQKKGVTLSCTTDRSGASLECDERRLKQVLINLLGNAVKFTPPGGAVGIEVVGDPSENVTRFTVWDTGIGIRKEDMSRLFQPFVQIDGSRTRPHGGTGLGLALSRRIVELHGGQVLAGSEPGKGSRFTVVLPWKIGRPVAGSASPTDPASTDSPAPQPERAIPEAIAKTRRILLVEDNPDLAGMLADHLESRGHQVLSVRAGADAVDVAVHERPDLILMDIEMPQTDGYEAMRRIRAQPGLETTPILAVTALAMPGDRERCLAAGATDYVSKPLSLGSLSAWIDQCGRSR